MTRQNLSTRRLWAFFKLRKRGMGFAQRLRCYAKVQGLGIEALQRGRRVSNIQGRTKCGAPGALAQAQQRGGAK